ncbi:MAG: type II toxin-antitoxin system VapC family toxin [Gammaproteobacteria bacterium]|nr:type II toxin-antitoxin system VapC family toxin [Gammaproteobacteria bacterium]
MKIYLDNCCFNRPFDDQSNQRIHLESEAIKVILKQCEQGHWHLIISDVNLFEIAKTADTERRRKLETFAKLAEYTVTLTEEMRQRAKSFESQGIKAFDAMHLACAENHTDVFLTVDDRLYRKAQILSGLRVSVTTPLLWTYEILQ